MIFLPMYLHELGYPVSFGGAALTAYLALGALGGFAGGWMAERIGGRAVVVQSFVGAIPFFLAFLVLPTLPGLVCLVVGSFIVQGSLPVNVVLGQELAPRHSSTISSLLMGAAWGVGALVVAPIGMLADAYGLRTRAGRAHRRARAGAALRAGAARAARAGAAGGAAAPLVPARRRSPPRRAGLAASSADAKATSSSGPAWRRTASPGRR